MVFLFELNCELPGMTRQKVILSRKIQTSTSIQLICHISAVLPVCVFSLFPAFLLFCLSASAQRKPEVPVDHRFDALDQLFKQKQKDLGN